MPVITSIKPQKNKKRVNIYLDGEFGFGVDLENFVKLSLKVEQQLTEIEIEEIKNKAKFQKNYNRLLNFVLRRPRSEKEVEDWFYKKKTPEDMQKALKQKLFKHKLLDDTAFAEWWVGQRQSFRPKSKRVLRGELIMKGIDKDTIEKIIGKTKVDEIDIAGNEIEKRLYKWKSLDKFTKKRKISEFLARKGFGWEVIKKAIEKFLD